MTTRTSGKSHRAVEALVFDGVTKSFGALPVLSGVDLSVSEGEIVALSGRNGAGKSTMTSLASGLLRPDTGIVRVAGSDPTRKSGRRALGSAGQDIGVYGPLTAAENLRFFAALAGVSRRERRERIDRVVDAMALSDLLGRSARNLSGGQRRRLHVACALVGDPPVLLLDEPTVAADVESRMAILDIVRKRAAGGCAILYTTHHLDEIEILDATVAVLDRGVICWRGTVNAALGLYGTTRVIATYSGPAPVALAGIVETVEGSTVTAATDTSSMSALVARLASAGRLSGLDVIPPSMEAAFLAITGERIGEEGAADQSATRFDHTREASRT